MNSVPPRARGAYHALAAAVLLLGAMPAAQAQSPSPTGDEQEKVLRVCADPNNLPLSNRQLAGYENKIAELFARDLGWKLEYTWFPQRMGFIRNTLRARNPDDQRFKCDLVIGVPVGFELASTTAAYYRSTYVLAYVKGRGLDSVQTPDDLLKLDPAKLKSLKFGVFGQTPPADWLLKYKLFDQVVPYQRQTGDPDQYPGEMVEKDLVAGKIDVAFSWGPIAGYYAKKVTAAPIAVVPFKPDPEMHFDYAMAMGVRYGEKEWKARVEELLEKNRGKIQGILAAYGVPQLDDAGNFIRVTADPAINLAGEAPPYRVADGKVDQSTYVGWRLFQTNCAQCHGSSAAGTDRAPDLLPRVKEMSQARFVGTVLQRYKELTPAGEAFAESGSREALMAEILQRKTGGIPMPAWDGDPNVKPHILDLYSYLRARADGALDERRPEPMK
ncbi:MAG: quinodehydrogenase-associated putative transporter substrate-binding family protein [Proteobacteria bacterium]|nr:quinodehydrogenase-associated putative transporter substrate-binding family protein [Pseudomonadota bacterium]